MVACASGLVSEGLIERAVTSAVERTHQRPLSWFSDGWQSYQNILMQAYRQPVMTGKRGRPRLVVPDTLSLTQTVKHRDEHGRLLSVEIRAALGASLEPAGTVHIERLNGTLRDRLGALTRKTHAFAKRDATWDALVGEAALRSQLSSSPSGFAVACCRLWRASVSPPLSRYGSGADQSSLVVPRIVNHPRSCHPLMGSLPTFQRRS